MFHTYIHLSSEAYIHTLREEQQHGKDRNSLWSLGVAFHKRRKQARRALLEHNQPSANFPSPRPALEVK
jgi:hypothetical protein